MIGRLSGALAAVLVVTPALALDALEKVFQVSYKHGGQTYVYSDVIVPLMPFNTCYNWYIRTSEKGAPISVVERLKLPRAIDWGNTGQDPEDPTQIEDDGTVAVTKIEMTTDEDGWFTHGWCAAEGDPTGNHLIEVSQDGNSLASFVFEVVDPADYDFPRVVTFDRAARSANNAW